MRPATLRVVSTDPASQGPFVIINAEDFDPAVHKLFEPPAEAEKTPVDEVPRKRRGREPST